MNALPSVSVVIWAYTERRWDDLLAAIDSAREQQPQIQAAQRRFDDRAG